MNSFPVSGQGGRIDRISDLLVLQRSEQRGRSGLQSVPYVWLHERKRSYELQARMGLRHHLVRTDGAHARELGMWPGDAGSQHLHVRHAWWGDRDVCVRAHRRHVSIQYLDLAVEPPQRSYPLKALRPVVWFQLGPQTCLLPVCPHFSSQSLSHALYSVALHRFRARLHLCQRHKCSHFPGAPRFQ